MFNVPTWFPHGGGVAMFWWPSFVLGLLGALFVLFLARFAVRVLRMVAKSPPMSPDDLAALRAADRGSSLEDAF